MTARARHRRLVVVRGSREKTRREAAHLVDELPEDEFLWVSDTPEQTGASDESSHGFDPVPSARIRKLLGQSLDAVVLDLHDGLDGDVLAQCHGFIWGGGHLILRMPAKGDIPTAGKDRLTVIPYGPEDVGDRLWHRLESAIERVDRASVDRREPLPSGVHDVRGTEEQAEIARRLAERFEAERPTCSAVLSDRGRGKSSALGMALKSVLETTDTPPHVAVTAGHRDSAAEVFRFALGTAEPPDDGPVRYIEPAELAAPDGPNQPPRPTPDIIIVDEAAQLAVPLLRRLVEQHPDADFAFATTTHGYEGTGRGFELRFLDWLADRPRPLVRLTLEEPIRWGADDPLEDFVFDALLLDAEPAELAPRSEAPETTHVKFDRNRLADNESTLCQFFGLLVQAHYRTTPSDLHRLLDAPNLNLHALMADGQVVAATWVAEEGELSEAVCEDLYNGRRIRGHALPETLVSHLGYRDAGQLEMMRSVRIAVHPKLRRLGLGTALVEAVHDHYEPDLFGTLFGATPGLLAFRRSVGYGLVRLGASRGRRTGEPSVAMLRPVSERARTLYAQARRELAAQLPVQLALMRAEENAFVDPTLEDALSADLPRADAVPEARLRQTLIHYAFGPRTYASAAHAVERFVQEHRGALETLDAEHRALIEARVLERAPWRETKRRADAPSFRMTMRGLRRAVRALVEQVRPDWRPEGR